jgi:hypothetical protein
VHGAQARPSNLRGGRGKGSRGAGWPGRPGVPGTQEPLAAELELPCRRGQRASPTAHRRPAAGARRPWRAAGGAAHARCSRSARHAAHLITAVSHLVQRMLLQHGSCGGPPPPLPPGPDTNTAEQRCLPPRAGPAAVLQELLALLRAAAVGAGLCALALALVLGQLVLSPSSSSSRRSTSPAGPPAAEQPPVVAGRGAPWLAGHQLPRAASGVAAAGAGCGGCDRGYCSCRCPPAAGNAWPACKGGTALPFRPGSRHTPSLPRRQTLKESAHTWWLDCAALGSSPSSSASRSASSLILYCSVVE